MSSDLLFNKEAFLALIKKRFSVRHKWHRLLLLLWAGAYFSLRLFRSKTPISLQTSVPSKLPIVTSNMLLWFFLVQAVSLSNKSDFRQCMIMSMSSSLIVV